MLTKSSMGMIKDLPYKLLEQLLPNFGYNLKGTFGKEEFILESYDDLGIDEDGVLYRYERDSQFFPVTVTVNASPTGEFFEPVDLGDLDGLSFDTVSEAASYRKITGLVGKRIWIEERGAYFNVVRTADASVAPNGMDVIVSTHNASFSFELEKPKTSLISPLSLGAKLDKTFDSTLHIARTYELCNELGCNFYWPTAIGDEGLTVSGNIPVPLGVKSYGGVFGTCYASQSLVNASRVYINVSTTLDVFTVTGNRLQGCNVAFDGVQFRSHPDVSSLDLSAQTINCIKFFGCFAPQINNCTFEHLNVTNAVTSDADTNVVKITNCHAGLIGDTTGALKVLTGGWTYGNAYNLQSAPDSTVENSYAEFCGDTGVRLASNSKLLNSFVDLNGTGLLFTGSNHVISGNSIKFSQRRAVVANANAKDWILDDCVIKYNNYQNASGTVDDTFAIRLTSGNTGWTISNINAIDGLIVGHPDKTALQNFIHLGASGNSGSISNVKIGDTAVAGARFFDPNGNIADGLVELDEIYVEGFTNNKAGLSLTSSTVSDIGKISVSGDTTSKALTLTTDSIVTGLVRSKSCGTLVNAGKACLSPKVIMDTAPDSIITKTGSSGGGAVAIRGFSFKTPISTNGGGTIDVVAMPDRFTGNIFIASGNSGAVSFMISARITWDGTVLTVTDEVSHTSSFTDITLVDNSGSLAIILTDGGTYAQDMIVDFDGYWIEL